ncbi:MAG: sensor histidine kinase [Methylococcales bacterium]|nr:sensor histidine kinase [Methylococcales bacterium]
MNLKRHLLLYITLVALICLMMITAYVLYRADKESKHKTQVMLQSIVKQLEVQLLQIDTGFRFADKFPDLSLWKQTHSITGVCIRFTSKNNKSSQSICHGIEGADRSWPKYFETLYRLFFNPGFEVTRQVTFKRQVYGVIAVTPSVDKELKQAWESMLALLELSVITVVSICLLVYISINRALRPAQIIVTGLEKMQQGDLTVRLPKFEILEWQRTSFAINQLAISQQQLLAERKHLSFKLITLQDEERRYLARELHDELGQCLAAISALAVSITQTAEHNCPEILEEVKSISQINNRIMDTVRTVLVRLRATDIDELGLELSLNSLITECNKQAADKTHYKLNIKGDCQQLEKTISTTLFRIIQESLTNINKHSSADAVMVNLRMNNEFIELTIDDNGDIDTLPLINNSGFGLLGIRERVYGFAGEINIDKNELGGLGIKITLPIKCKEDLKYG